MADIGQDQTDIDSADTEETALDRLVAEVSAEPEEAKTDTVDPNDTDAIEEAAARKALAEEEAAAKAEVKAPEKTAETKPATEPDKGKETEAKHDKQTPMIPKPRFDEVAATAAYWKGIADERGRALAAKDATAQPENAQPTPEQQIANIRGEIKNLAKQVDDGKLLMSDFEDKRQELLDQELTIRETLRKPAQTEAPKRGSDLYLEQKTAELETSHPYVAELSPEDLRYLTIKAVAALADDGIKLPAGDLDAGDQLMLRTKIAELSDKYGPVLTGKELKKTGTVPAGKPALSKEAQQREAKLAAAASAPPDLTAAGRATSPATGYTEDQIMAMSEEQIEALPQSVRDKIMGRLSA